MIERVAMRIYEAVAHDALRETGRGGKNWHLTTEDERNFARMMASAAIDAIENMPAWIQRADGSYEAGTVSVGFCRACDKFHEIPHTPKG